MEALLHFDIRIFQLVNSQWTAPWLDVVMPMVRNKYFWLPFYIFLISWLAINFKGKGIWHLVAIIILISVSDQLSSHLIKPWVGRLRPCADPYMHDFVRSLVRCGKSFSFPSSHATNHFALAFYLIVHFSGKWKWTFAALFLWAALISYAQVYVGVHYPLDVFAGANLGIVLGISWGIMCKRWIPLELT